MKTKSRHCFDDPRCLDDLDDAKRALLVNWCKRAFRPRKTPLNRCSSYGLKHLFERAAGGFYVTNGQFKGAMLIAGFEPVNRNEVNWSFCISSKGIDDAHSIPVERHEGCSVKGIQFERNK